MPPTDAGWSSLVARRAHNPKVVGSNPAPATKHQKRLLERVAFFVSDEKVLLKQWHGIFHETVDGLQSPSHCTLCSMLKRYPLRPMAAVAGPGDTPVSYTHLTLPTIYSV